MNDPFESHARAIEQPADDAFIITPSNTQTLPFITRGLYVGTGGDVTVRMKNGTVVTFSTVSPATILPLRVVEVLQTGTSASNLIGLV